jgi:hypothetical protein
MSEIVSPFSEPRDGFLFLGQLVLWRASMGGALNSEQAAEQWDEAEREVVSELGRGALNAEGANGRGEYVLIPPGKWPLASSRWEPGRPTITYPDRIGNTLGGTLEVGPERWEGIRVRKREAARFRTTASRVGAKPKYDWPLIRREAERLMDYHGDFSADDPVWDAQARLEEQLMTFCNDRWQRAPSPSQLRAHLKPTLEAWRAKQAP